MNGKKIRVRRHLDAWEDFSPEPGRQHVTFEDKDRLLPELSILGWVALHPGLRSRIGIGSARQGIRTALHCQWRGKLVGEEGFLCFESRNRSGDQAGRTAWQ